MRRNSTIFFLATAIFLLALGTGKAFQGTKVSLGEGEEILRLPLALESHTTYEIRVNMRTNLPNAVVQAEVYYYDMEEVVDHIIISRGLGSEGHWQSLGLELRTPDQEFRSELVLTAHMPGEYWWDGLSVVRVGKANLSVQEFWEQKFAEHGAFYTGLVIDARHLDLRRGMSPRVYSESGQLIYGGVLASPDFVQDIGVVAYGSELTPELLQRIQVDPDYPYASPLVIEAIGVVEPFRTGVYISDADAERILESLVQYDFLARYAVVFLLD